MSERLDELVDGNVIMYKGFRASYGWSNASGCWLGFLMFTESDIFFRFDKEEEAMDALKDAVERLLSDCRTIMECHPDFGPSELLQ